MSSEKLELMPLGLDDEKPIAFVLKDANGGRLGMLRLSKRYNNRTGEAEYELELSCSDDMMFNRVVNYSNHATVEFRGQPYTYDD